MLRAVVASALAWAAVGCDGGPQAEPAADAVRPPLLLISIDGFRPDYLQRYDAPTLRGLAADGLHAREGMIPVFPTKTFPNHYSIATGLYPEHHGIVSNTLYDAERDAWFRISDREAQADARWWGGEPLWVTAERQGRSTATLFWVGSEAAIGGVRPTRWTPYDASIPGRQRVDQVLSWLDLPLPQRPAFLTLYFGEVDSAGHRYGPDARQTAEAVGRVDRHLARLVDGLKVRGLFDTINLLIVSDHGMTGVSPERAIFLEDYLDLRDVLLVDASPVLMLRPRPGKLETVYAALEGAHPSLTVYRKQNLPRRLRFQASERIPPIVGLAAEGWSIVPRRRGFDPERAPKGMHGYDNALTSMRALFVAHGPAFRRGRVEPFECVHLYELMAAVLGLEPAPNDGDPAVAAELLRAPSASSIPLKRTP